MLIEVDQNAGIRLTSIQFVLQPLREVPRPS